MLDRSVTIAGLTKGLFDWTVIADAQIVLSVGDILSGSFAIPLYGFRLILCYAKGAGKECATQFIPGLGIALVRSGAIVSASSALSTRSLA